MIYYAFLDYKYRCINVKITNTAAGKNGADNGLYIIIIIIKHLLVYYILY